MRGAARIAQLSLLGFALPVLLTAQDASREDPASAVAPAPPCDGCNSAVVAPLVAAPVDATEPKRGWLRSFARHERAIWLSPFHLKGSDARWLIPFGAATAALIASDVSIAGSLPDTTRQVQNGEHFSRLGAPYTLGGIAGGAYLLGRFTGNERLRDTGRIGGEALLHSFIVTHALKNVLGRERPEEGEGRGHFFQGRFSFPSGHSMMSWALASVVAHEYSDRKVVVVGAYASALAVNVGRSMARKHYVSDSLVGAVLGYSIGTYLYKQNRRENRNAERAWVPQITPQFNRAFRTYGVSLTWNR